MWAFELPGETLELHRAFQILNLALQSAFTESLLDALHKFRPNNLRERPDGVQETVAGGKPPLAIFTEPSTRYYEVQMVMGIELLIPGVQYGGKTDLSPQALVVLGKLPEGLGGRPQTED